MAAQPTQAHLKQRFVWHPGDLVWLDTDDDSQKPQEHQQRALSEDLRRWRTRAIDDVKAGKPFRPFVSTCLPPDLHNVIQDALQRCTNVEEVRALFARAKGGAFGPGEWQNTDKEIQKQLATLKTQGITQLRWQTAVGACDTCTMNDQQVRPLGQPFLSGAILPPHHPNCVCTVVPVPLASAQQRYNHVHDAHGKFGFSNDSQGGGGGGGGATSAAAHLRALEHYMAAKYPQTHFDFTGADPAVMGPACQQLDMLMSKYPEVGQSFAYIGTGRNAPPGYGADRMPRESIACCISRTTGSTPYSTMILNLDYFGNAPRTASELQLNAAAGWFASGSKEGGIPYVMTHEFGHAVDAYLATAGNHAQTGKVYDVATEAYMFKGNSVRMGNTVSGYARKGGAIEQFAEAFASLHFAPPAQQAPYTKRLGALLDKVLPNGSSASWQVRI